MLNKIDRFHLALDVLDRVPGMDERYPGLRQRYEQALVDARGHTRRHGEDSAEITGWTL